MATNSRPAWPIATGNGLNNELRGNSAVNILTGLGGDDVYVVQNTDDTVVEAADGGVDKLYSVISRTLGANVEDLRLTRTAYKGQGNALANSISGKSSANLFIGGNGNDTLTGNGGSEITSSIPHLLFLVHS